MCASAGMTGLPFLRLGGEADGVEFALAGQRCAGVLEPAEDVLLVFEVVGVPALDQHADPARDQVAAAAHPRLVGLVADPDEAVHRRRVLGLDVVGAVLEAHEVARRRLRGARGRGAAEAELRPPHDDGAAADAGEVADDVEGDLRIVGAGLHAEVAAAARRVERVTGQRGQICKRSRAFARPARSACRTGSGRSRP